MGTRTFDRARVALSPRQNGLAAIPPVAFDPTQGQVPCGPISGIATSGLNPDSVDFDLTPDPVGFGLSPGQAVSDQNLGRRSIFVGRWTAAVEQATP